MELWTAFESDESFEARLRRIPEIAQSQERAIREAAQWEKHTRETLIGLLAKQIEMAEAEAK